MADEWGWMHHFPPPSIPLNSACFEVRSDYVGFRVVDAGLNLDVLGGE